jgi:hypothetical protein
MTVPRHVENPLPAADGDETPLSSLSIHFLPLDLVAEWARCGEAADFLARFLTHDFEDRETAGSVLSTAINEVVENAVKFSSDKRVAALVTVAEYSTHVTIRASNAISAAQAERFADALSRITAGDPEALFAERLAHPPETGGAGIGLIMLRKDYGASIGARVTDSGSALEVEVTVTIANEEVEKR